jgi:SAM-dependent methyltransferase
METIFNQNFWVTEWEKDKKGDTYTVHKGFSTPEYWDNAARSYNRNKREVRNRRLEKTLDFFKRSGLLFEGMTVLDVGCGTGMVALELAKQGARVTALDFSKRMLDVFKQDTPNDIKGQITLLHEDWYKIDVDANGWKKKFDLVIAFMSPGVAGPESFFKLMSCSKKGCAIRGWAAKRTHPILTELWQKIMGIPLTDKPQSILYKINLLFSLGFFPDITFDTIEWEQPVSVKDEFDSQMAFFQKVSKKPTAELDRIIHGYLAAVSTDNQIIRQHKGLTATAVWKMNAPCL